MPFVSSWKTALVALRASIALGAPSSLSIRQFDGTRPAPGIVCETLIRPNFDDCSSIISGNSYFGSGNEIEVCVNANACRVWREGNCRISFCNNEGSETCNLNKEWGRRTNEIIGFCSVTEQGGYETPAEPAPWTEVAVRSNQEWRMALSGTTLKTEAYQEMSVEENAAEVKLLEAAKFEARQMSARQSETFQIGNRRLNVEKPGAAYEVTGPLRNGATFESGKTETQSIGITASVTLGGTLFEAMTAEIGISVSAELSISSSTTVSFDIECEGEQEGVVAWRPLFDYYEGTFQPSGDAGSIWVPLDNDVSRSNFDYRCIG